MTIQDVLSREEAGHQCDHSWYDCPTCALSWILDGEIKDNLFLRYILDKIPFWSDWAEGNEWRLAILARLESELRILLLTIPKWKKPGKRKKP